MALRVTTAYYYTYGAHGTAPACVCNFFRIRSTTSRAALHFPCFSLLPAQGHRARLEPIADYGVYDSLNSTQGQHGVPTHTQIHTHVNAHTHTHITYTQRHTFARTHSKPI